MRLTLFTQHFAPHFEGGTEAVVRAQAGALAGRGHAVSIVSGTDRAHEGEDVVRAEVDGMPVAFLPRLADETYDLALERPRLRALILELAGDAELAHVHHWATLSGTLVRDLSERLPVVVTLHDLFVTCPRFFRVPAPPVERCPERGDFAPCARCVAPDAPGVSEVELEAALRARAGAWQAELDAARVVVVPSRAHGRALARWVDLSAEKLAVVPHGLCAPLRPVFAPPWGGMRGEGRLRVLFLGHRSRVKGVGDLVAALAGLPADQRARVELICLGTEVEPGLDERLRDEAGDVALRFAGAYELAELPARLATLGGAHLVAAPSRVRESYGLVVDEALALGLPVWVSDRGAPPERVGEAGRVLPAEDPGAWRDALGEVLAAPDILERERRAIPPTLRTARDAALELEGIYRELLSP